MISKKILALVLAISVIVCALPAFSVSAAAWPEVEETLTNPQVWFNNGFAISLENASDGLKACNANGIVATGGMTVSGAVTIGGEVINLNKFTIRTGNPNDNTVSGWGSDFICHDENFKAKLAASEAPGLERDGDGNVIITSSGDEAVACLRNFVRYILNEKNIDYSTFTNEQLQTTSLEATAESLTFAPYSAEMLESYPEGTLFLPTTTAYLNQGLSSDFKVSNMMYVPVAENVGVGPFAIYELRDAGTYDVWLLKRDFNSNTTQRDVYLDINGKTFAFTGTEGAPDVLDYTNFYAAPEDTYQELTVKAGEKVVIQVNNKTSVWAGSFGLLLVPSNKVEGATITGTMQNQAKTQAAYLDNVANGYVKYITPGTKTVNVTIGDTDLEVESGTAKTWYPTINQIDANGNYVDYVTLLDVIVAATEAGVEMPFELVQKITSDKVTPVTYDTTVATGNPWPTNSNGTANLWGKLEVFCTNSTTPYSMTITAPKEGNYYMFANGYGWDENRHLTISVNGTPVEEATGDTAFFKSVSSYTLTVTESPVALKYGANTITLTTSGNWIRMAYLGFVEAETRDEALEIIGEITASKDAFNSYYAIKGCVYGSGKISDYDGGFIVNGENYANSNLEYVAIADGAEIGFIESFDATNFFPVKAGMSGSCFGGRWATDHMYNDTTDYSSKFISYAKLPFNAHPLDALAGCYLNGYVTITADFTGQTVGAAGTADTSGDDRVSKVFIRDLPIRHAKGDGSSIHLGINGNDAERWGMGGNLFIDLDGDGVDEEYVTTLQSGAASAYDFSNLYITNSNSAAPARVTATDMGNGVYRLTCNKSVPVCLVKVTKVDGVVKATEFENIVIDFMDKDGVEINVAEGQTVYVWEGTAVPKGSIMIPLCAPITR